MYRLLTKLEIEWLLSKFFLVFVCLWTSMPSHSINTQKPEERGQYLAIFTEQGWSMKELLPIWKENAIFLRNTADIIPSEQDSYVYSAQLASHSSMFGISCLHIAGLCRHTITIITEFGIQGVLGAVKVSCYPEIGHFLIQKRLRPKTFPDFCLPGSPMLFFFLFFFRHEGIFNCHCNTRRAMVRPRSNRLLRVHLCNCDYHQYLPLHGIFEKQIFSWPQYLPDSSDGGSRCDISVSYLLYYRDKEPGDTDKQTGL